MVFPDAKPDLHLGPVSCIARSTAWMGAIPIGSHRLSVAETNEPDGRGGRFGVVTIRAARLAVVCWQSQETLRPDAAKAYLAKRWKLSAPQLVPQITPWSRNAGPQAQFDAPVELGCGCLSSRPGGLAAGLTEALYGLNLRSTPDGRGRP